MEFTNDFSKNLKRLRLAKRLSQKELSALLKVSAVTIQNWESGRKRPSLDTLVALSQTFNVPIDDLVGNTGHTFVSTDNVLGFLENGEADFLLKYRELDSHGKSVVSSVCDLEYDRITEYNKNKEITPIKAVKYIPEFLYPAAAGYAAPVSGSDFELIPVAEDVPDGADYAVRIDGDSMEPTINNQSVVYVRKSETIPEGKVGIFSLDGEIYCKRYFVSSDCVRLKSDNKFYDDIIIRPDGNQTLCCLGVVLF